MKEKVFLNYVQPTAEVFHAEMAFAVLCASNGSTVDQLVYDDNSFQWED